MTTPGIAFSRGSIVLVPFPFTDLSANKKRPALVVSPDWLNSVGEDRVLVALTSQVPNTYDRRTEILIRSTDLASGSIVSDSLAKLSKLFTCEVSIIEKQVARLRPTKVQELLEGLQALFAP